MTQCSRCNERLPDNDYPHTCTPDVEAAIAHLRDDDAGLSDCCMAEVENIYDALRAAQEEVVRIYRAVCPSCNHLQECACPRCQKARVALASPAGGQEEEGAVE